MPTVIALVVALVASLISTYITARRNQIIDVESQATVVANNASAGLAFADKPVVDDVVQAFRARSNIDMVCVYDTAGHTFSSFQRRGQVCPLRWPAHALASDSDRKAIVAAGFNDHIVKPFSFPDLVRAVSRAA